MNKKKELIIKLDHIQKIYQDGKIKYKILNDINLELFNSDIYALLGASGSGKSTLLNIIGLLDNSSKGHLKIKGNICDKLDEKRASEIRRDNIGFIFQFHHLLPDFTVLENVNMPLLLKKNLKKSIINDMSLDILTSVGLKNKVNRFPSELSGGEKQRVAIARALVHSPSIIIADEPTGNLDPSLSNDICDIIIDLVKKINGVAIIATHNLEIAKKIGKNMILDKGIINIKNV